MMPVQPDHSANTVQTNAFFFSAEEIMRCITFCREWKCWNNSGIAVLLFFLLCRNDVAVCGAARNYETLVTSWLCSGTTSLVWYHIPRHRQSSSLCQTARRLPWFQLYHCLDQAYKTDFHFKFHRQFLKPMFAKIALDLGYTISGLTGPTFHRERWNTGVGH